MTGMKLLLFLMILIWQYSCKPANKLTTGDSNINDISNQEVALIIDTLASDYFEGRGFGSTGIEKAAVFIENYLQQNNIKAFFSSYRDSFQVGARTGYNIVGVIEGNDAILKNEFIILSAHYDHIGLSSDKTDSVYNGANDNATGVSAVLTIAKKLNKSHVNRRSIIVALFSGEEIGLTGSEHFAEKLSAKSSDLYCNVNIDMIGSVLTNKPGNVYISGFEKSNMGTQINRYFGNEIVVNLDNEMIFDVFQLSDNYPLFKKLHIPAHTFCTFDFNNYSHYHELSDEIENVDIKNTGIIVRNIATSLSHIANTENREILLNKK